MMNSIFQFHFWRRLTAGFNAWRWLRVHTVVITDETGLENSFRSLKRKLMIADATLSVIYLHDSERALYRQELEILANRNQQRLTTHFVPCNPLVPEDAREMIQEKLELEINCSLQNKIRFHVSGKPEFVTVVSEMLEILGVKTSKIQGITTHKRTENNHVPKYD